MNKQTKQFCKKVGNL